MNDMASLHLVHHQRLVDAAEAKICCVGVQDVQVLSGTESAILNRELGDPESRDSNRA